MQDDSSNRYLFKRMTTRSIVFLSNEFILYVRSYVCRRRPVYNF